MAGKNLATIRQKARTDLKDRLRKAYNHLQRLEQLDGDNLSEPYLLARAYAITGLSQLDLAVRFMDGRIGTVGTLYLTRLERAIKNGRLNQYTQAQLDRALTTIERARNGDKDAFDGIWLWLKRGHVMRAAEAERDSQ